MKTFFSIALSFSVLFLISCNKDLENIQVPHSPSETTHLHTKTVPINEALEQLDAILSVIDQNTRSVNSSNRIIDQIQVCGGASISRSKESDLPDTMVYIVNFTNNNGFAVLGANCAYESVYAITEKGSLDPNKLNTAIASAYHRQREQNVNTRSTTEYPSRFKEIEEDIIYELLASSLIATPRIAAPDTIKVSYGPWTTNIDVAPLVTVKWSQKYPFNTSMPESDYFAGSLIYQGRFPVGCGVVALAQIISKTRHPIYAPAGNNNYDWNNLCTLSTSQNHNSFITWAYPGDLNSTQQTYTTQLADVLYYLGILCNASSDEFGTGIATEDAISCLQLLDNTYYQQAIKTSTNLTENITNCLDHNKPVYTVGSKWSSTDGWMGHAWVTDGYFSISRNVYKTIQYGSGPTATITQTESKKYLHFNWGFLGYGDGYFEAGVYDMAQRYSIDPDVDDFGEEENRPGTTDYGNGNYIFTY